jgi:hypothetical protein
MSARIPLLLSFVLSGCMSIPVSTIVRFATFDDEDLLQIDPSQVRMRITSDNDAPLIVKKTKLKMEMVAEDGAKATMPGAVILESEEDLHPEKSMWSLGYTPEHVYVLRLDEDAAASFQKLQDKVRRNEKGYLTVGVDYDFSGKEKAKVTVELKLAAQEDYFTLLDKATFSPEDLQEDARQSAAGDAARP